MVTCQICKKEYKIITNQHLSKHNINTNEYIKKFPEAKLVSDETLQKYAEGTRRHYQTLSKEQKTKLYSSRIYSKEGKEKIKNALKNSRHKINYNDPSRTKAISDAKKAWWNNKTKEERSLFFKQIVIPNTISKLGYDNFVKKCRKAGINGYNAVISKGVKKERNGFESYMFFVIKQKGYEYIEQFEIDGWFYDCFIPEKNLILEFDGDYWHANVKEDCINNRLENQWEIDRKKDNLAIKKGYNIIRIRESNKESIKSIV